jgi:hypothetical protein
MKKDLRKRILVILGTVIVVVFIGLWSYLGDYYRADETARAALIANDQVDVKQEGNLTIFSPVVNDNNIGFIFYPGGKVEDVAYAPLMHKLAEKGITAVIVGMPFNLAVFNPNGAEKVIGTFPEIKYWIIGGHSLGGAMASDYLAENSNKLEGLVLMGAYPNKDLSQIDDPLLSLFGSEDKIVNRQAFEAARIKVPKKTVFYEITGGNHSGFGNYGLQSGDGVAKISSEEQQNIAVEKIVEMWKGDRNE